jgi:hypothetical protein
MLKLKYALGPQKCAYLASTRVPTKPTTVQMPNLALIERKLITMCMQTGVRCKAWPFFIPMAFLSSFCILPSVASAQLVKFVKIFFAVGSALDLGLTWGSVCASYYLKIEQVVLTWALLPVSIIACISSENQWLRGRFLLTSSSQRSVLRYMEEKESEIWIEGGNPRLGLRSKDLRLNTSAWKD